MFIFIFVIMDLINGGNIYSNLLANIINLQVKLIFQGICYRQKLIIDLLKHQKEFESRGVGVTYPMANTQGNAIYLANVIGHVQTYKNDSIKVLI